MVCNFRSLIIFWIFNNFSLSRLLVIIFHSRFSRNIYFCSSCNSRFLRIIYNICFSYRFLI
nr:MAG TPA_asm: hypothetical protein [Bacteriophage sp.]